MTIAEQHGKISSTGRNLHNQMEDLLTSDVFTACKYLRPSTLLLPFLSTAISMGGCAAEDILMTQVKSAEYSFWPMLNHGEPDVVIVIEDNEGALHLVVIEAKYFSGKSSIALGEEELETATAPSDQLAGEYKDLLTLERQLSLGYREVRSRSLIYVTAHRSIPSHSLEESMREVSRFHPGLPAGPIYWTSWFHLIPLIMQTETNELWEKPMLSDLHALLVRKGFIQFRGFSFVPYVYLPYATAFYSVSGASKGNSYEWAVSHLDPISWYDSYIAGSSHSYFESVNNPPHVESIYPPGARQ